MKQQGLTAHELRAWRVSFQMLELLRTRIEQQLQASSGLSNADYTVLALLSEAPDGRMRAYELSRRPADNANGIRSSLTRLAGRYL